MLKLTDLVLKLTDLIDVDRHKCKVDGPCEVKTHAHYIDTNNTPDLALGSFF